MAGMLIAKDKVDLEQLYVYMFGFGSFGLDGRKQGAERLPAFETVRKKEKTTKKHGNQFGWEETRNSVYRYIDICI